MVTLSGPMFEPAKWGVWESVLKKQGAHYNIYSCKDEDGMEGLRDFFPDGTANDLNFCLFSTSGVHGMYTTIEEAEKELESVVQEYPPQVTFLIVQPRIVCTRFGNCQPKDAEDIKFLKKLRDTSQVAIQSIGYEEVNDEDK